ncbi:MAG: SDR family NAD(P)-dependent oxidoreductase [Myxococcota bacterium]
MDLQLTDRVALVTGSHRGTGAGIAGALAREGARVAVHGFDPGQADAVAEHLVAEGADAAPFAGDITDDAGASRLAGRVLDHFGRVDVLVNSYGVAEAGDWSTTSTDEWVALYQRNVLSGVRLVHALVPGMRERGWGRVVWLGTIGELRPAARMPHYYASKATLASICVSLAKEFAGSGITVNLVSPGLIATEEVRAHLRRRAERKGWGGDWEDIQRAALAEMTGASTGRIVEVDEVADLVAFLASERAGSINGTRIRIDGGASETAV